MNPSQPENRPDRFQPHDIVWDRERIQRLWDFYGTSPAKDTVYFGATVGAHVARIIRRLGLLRHSKVIVDFSCGAGHLIEHCLAHIEAGATVIGYDPSEKSVQEANKRNGQAANFGGAFHLSSLPSTLEDGCADLVLLTEVIEHLDDLDLDAILRECRRILSPSGKLFVTTPNSEQLDRAKTICPECGCVFHRWQHVRSWTTNQLEEVLSSLGFGEAKAKKITWGNEWIDIAFSIFRMKKTGIYAVAAKSKFD